MILRENVHIRVRLHLNSQSEIRMGDTIRLIVGKTTRKGQNHSYRT
jgi:hypothetical protein